MPPKARMQPRAKGSEAKGKSKPLARRWTLLKRPAKRIRERWTQFLKKVQMTMVLEVEYGHWGLQRQQPLLRLQPRHRGLLQRPRLQQMLGLAMKNALLTESCETGQELAANRGSTVERKVWLGHGTWERSGCQAV